MSYACAQRIIVTQPCISVGNVAQLTSDLLITTLKMERVGHLYDQCLLPLVCQSAFDHNTAALSTSAEGMNFVFVYHVSYDSIIVYITREMQLAVIQLRSPIAKVMNMHECNVSSESCGYPVFSCTFNICSVYH